MEPIATVHSCFHGKFGIPKQSGLASHSTATLRFFPQFSRPEAFEGIAAMSHIWVIFQFHQVNHWKNSVRPPAIGGNQKMGVFATRSPFRPNNIGLSLVELKEIRFEKSGTEIDIFNHDLLDGTPVLDIKPYHPNDSRARASYGWIEKTSVPQNRSVYFTENLRDRGSYPPKLFALIEELLFLNPKPSYHQEEKKYGMTINDHNVRWVEHKDGAHVISIEKI